MNFESRIVLEPAEFPGVRCVLNKMTEGRRINLRLRMSEISSKLREFARRTQKLKEGAIQETERELHLTLKKLRALGDGKAHPEVYAVTVQAATDLAEKLSTLPSIDEVREIEQQTAELIEDRFTPEWVRWGLKSIEGLVIDGEPATVETMIQDGPRPLYKLIAAEIQKAAGLLSASRPGGVLILRQWPESAAHPPLRHDPSRDPAIPEGLGSVDTGVQSLPTLI